MPLDFTQLSWWLWSGKGQEGAVSADSQLNSSTDLGLGTREPDTVKFSTVNGSKMHSTSRRVKKKRQSRDQGRIDREFDGVLVPSDCGCLSGSESEDSDWSIGWLEPHAPGFLSEDETESSFAVLVPCYGRGRGEPVQDSRNEILSAILSSNLPVGHPAGSMNFMEEFLSSLHKSG